jgi:hypothetical protein
MGLFQRNAKPQTLRQPDVWIEHAEGSSVYTLTRTSRFYFTDVLIGDSKRVPVPGTDRVLLSSGEFMPDRASYVALRLLLRAVINQDEYGKGLRDMDLTRCYRNYIALQWAPEYQPEHDTHEAQERIEREVSEILANYFDWDRPIAIGHFKSQSERFALAQKLDVKWVHGSY